MLRRALRERVLLLDGGLGSLLLREAQLPEASLSAGKVSLESFCLEQPALLQSLHESFLEVGCDIVTTNSFQASPLALTDHGLASQARELNLAAARLARAACDACSSHEQPRFVLGSMGPGRLLPSLGQIDRPSLERSYTVQARALLEGGVDGLLIETCQDPVQIQAALAACHSARDEAGSHALLCVSLTLEPNAKLLVGTSLEELVEGLAAEPLDVLGINCSRGPREMEPWLRRLSQLSPFPLCAYPNAGLPAIVDGRARYSLAPADFADWLLRFVEEDGARLVGGCCGITPEHLAAARQFLPLP